MADQASDAKYWGTQLRQTVKFADGCRKMLASSPDAVIEVGVGRTMTTMTRDLIDADGDGPLLIASMPDRPAEFPGHAAMARAAARLWVNGVTIDWEAMRADRPWRRVQLPAYPFDRRRYSVLRVAVPAEAVPAEAVPAEAVPAEIVPAQAVPAGTVPAGTVPREGGGVNAAPPGEVDGAHRRPDLATRYRRPQAGPEAVMAGLVEDLLGIDGVGADDSFLDLGGDSLLAIRLLARVNETFGIDATAEDFFEAPTVCGLAQLVERLLAQLVESLDPAEVSALLADLDKEK